MKNKWNILLLAVYLITAPICTVISINYLGVFALILPVVPAFCSQLLLCRVSKRTWVRCLPFVPVVMLLSIAMFYLVRDSGWDRLAALLIGLASIAPVAGTALGWGVWYLGKRRERENE